MAALLETAVVKRVHEVWEDHGQISMFVRGAKSWRALLSPDARLLRTFEAESTFEAFRTHNRLMGFGEWTPPEGVPDTLYTETFPPSDDSQEWPFLAHIGPRRK